MYNNSSSITKSLEYIGGYVIENDILSYYSMAEGRVRNEGGGFGLSMKMEYFITDHQGNVRVSFEDNNGTALLKQENSYYAFGMQMAGGYLPSNPNKKLYNVGSEWQDDIEGLADYYSTFFREYDPIIGRFNGVDPVASYSISTYAYSFNNPIMFNDPLGDRPARDNRPDPGYLLGLEMQAEYKAWHDARYGDNSSWSTVQRTMALWGWGDWSGDGNSGGGGGGGGMSEFNFYGSYAGMKIRLGNYGTGAKYGYNKWGEFGYWKSERREFKGEEAEAYGNTHKELGLAAGRVWVSLSGSSMGSSWPFPWLWGGRKMGLTTIQYNSKIFPGGSAGLEIKLGYRDNGSGLKNFNFIQTIRTNVPLGGARPPYNDPQPPDDTLPFYWTNTELPSFTNKDGYHVVFLDAPSRKITEGTFWIAELSVVGMDRTGKYVPITSMTYGFEIKNSAVNLYPITTFSSSALSWFHLNSIK